MTHPAIRLLATEYLWLLLGVAALGIGYFARYRRSMDKVTQSSGLRKLLPPGSRDCRLKQHVLVVLILLSLTALVLGLARPARIVLVPREVPMVVILAVDVSGSMKATDVMPSRFEAARSAALNFVAAVRPNVYLGLVTFSSRARIQVEPTTDRAVLQAALQQLSVSGGTAAGSALLESLGTIAETRKVLDRAQGASRQNFDVGHLAAAAIVLLSDGASKAGPPVEEAAAAVAKRGVPVFAIAFGTDAGMLGSQSVPSDRKAMREVATITSGGYFEAETADELAAIYKDLSAQVGFQPVQREYRTVIVASALLVLGLAAAILLYCRVVFSRRSAEI